MACAAFAAADTGGRGGLFTTCLAGSDGLAAALAGFFAARVAGFAGCLTA